METARRDTTREAPRPLDRRERTDRVATVIARIREDARTEPKRYIDDSEVPAGGE